MKNFKTFYLNEAFAPMPSFDIPPMVARPFKKEAPKAVKPPLYAQNYWTPEFLKYIMSAENGIKSGFDKKTGLWHPHKSVEGGTQTIAYGHKLLPGEKTNNLTELQARKLLAGDLAHSASVVTRLIDKKYGTGTFAKLSTRQKEMLIDFAFNGVLNQFPKFIDGVVHNKADVIKAEYERYVNGKPLKDRNARFAARYLN